MKYQAPIIHDTLEDFPKDIANLPLISFTDMQLNELKKIDSQFDDVDSKEYSLEKKNKFKYVYLPWKSKIYHIVGKDDYFSLRTNRNKDLITHDEQQLLGAKNIAVLGMSVGSNIALMMTQAGIGSKYVLADFDTLETSNTNRLLFGLPELGRPKCEVVAEKMNEIDPFTKIKLMPKGVESSTDFSKILELNKIDLIVEEVDDIRKKIEVRKVARKLKIPVIMVTDNGDGIVIHIERYDLDYKDILGHSDLFWKETIENIHEKKDVAQIIINPIIGGEEFVDNQMLQSVEKVFNSELVSWSQLGSAAMLAGVYVTYIAKMILLGKNKTPYLRSYVNPSQNVV